VLAYLTDWLLTLQQSSHNHTVTRLSDCMAALPRNAF